MCNWIFKHDNGNYIWTATRTTALLLQCILRLHANCGPGSDRPFFFYTSSSIFTSTAQVTTYFSNCLLFCANKPLKRVSFMKVGHFQYSFNRFSSDFKHAYNACFKHNAVPPPPCTAQTNMHLDFITN